MSVIIRLQNLPWSANALDIREFFKGLSIPEGGVHIVGGELGDAFIAFSTDEDARLAMQKSGSSLKGIQVTLLLSSRTEMQKVIEAARQQAMALQGYLAPPVIPTQPQQPSASLAPSAPSASQAPSVPALQQTSASAIPHQPLSAHAPYQGHTHSHIEAQQQVTPHMSSHINSPPTQPNLQQAPPPMSVPPSSHPSSGPSQTPSHASSHIPNQAASHGPHNSTAAANDIQASHSNSSANVTDKKEDKKSTSSSSSSKRDKGRDSRRRRSKSRSRTRSRSRDRDRRRRHRTRSRSRSRDRSGRSRRRTRSRERDRGRDRNRDRDRDKERSRIGRDRGDRFSQENNDIVAVSQELPSSKDITSSGAEGIPGLGDIPSASMRGPLPSLSEPIKNSPIQTPSPAPMPAYSSAHSFNPVPSYTTAPPFITGLPFSMGNMSVPPPSIPMLNTFHEPMDTEAPDDHPIIVEGPGDYMDNQLSRKPPIPRNENMGGLLRGSDDSSQRPENKGLLGDGPPFGSFGRGMAPRNNENFGFVGHPRNRSLPNEPENEYNIDQFDSQGRPDIPQRGWDSKEGKDTSNNKSREFRDEKDTRDRSSFRNEMDPREGRNNREERLPKDVKESHEEKGSHDDPERLGGWESRGKREPHGERGTRWDAADRRDDTDESSNWSSRGKREGWNGREEDKWTGRNSGDKRENWNEKESWKHDPHGWEEEAYYHMDQDRQGEEHDRFSEAYSYRGHRSRGLRGMERGRISRGGRGFNPRFGAYHEGYQDENLDDGFGFRGGYRGRGGFRGRGGPYSYREGSSEWGDDNTTCSVEIRNIPTNTSYRAIRELFRGIYVPKTSIKLLADDQGNRIDVALLQFSLPRDAHKAVRYSGNYIFDNKVEVNLIPEAKYEAAVDINKMTNNKSQSNKPPSLPEDKLSWANSACVCVSGLPVGCTDHDVAQMFTQFKIEDIVLEREKGTRQPSGRCFVRLTSTEDAQQAVNNLLNASIDGSPLTVEICPPEAMVPAVRDRDLILSSSQVVKPQQDQKMNSKPQTNVENKTEKQNGEGSQSKNPAVGADLLTDSVSMKGVPKDATEINIRDFFSDEGLVPERVHFCDPDTNGMREVYVMFPLIEDARRAVGKTKQQLCKVKVEVEMIAKPLVMIAMGLPFDPLELIRKGQKVGAPAVGGKSEKNTENVNTEEKVPTQSKETSESASKEKHQQQQQKQQQQQQQQGNQNESASDSESNRDQVKESPHNMEQQSSSSFSNPGGMIQGLYRGGLMGHFPGGSRGYRPRGEMRGMSRMPGGLPGPRGPSDGSFSRIRGPLSLLRDSLDKPIGEEAMGTAIPPENFGKPGCVVALKNVPYRATTDDILGFFQEFATLRPENIIRRYNEFNQPTADARVAFPTPQEAQRAVQTLNKKYMTNRQVFLSLVQE
ncbi:hypothetical protein OTU49_008979 [Cherax quadricarinatus]|uniref:RRM domain-containing protein n=2 Tax=Cherax quadricarinatus TaxID=27406 RepID=A0AAW0WLB4_CHEQU|nr:uncharacterized protein LOC128700400 [Cherax quadricarinatus]